MAEENNLNPAANAVESAQSAENAAPESVENTADANTESAAVAETKTEAKAESKSENKVDSSAKCPGVEFIVEKIGMSRTIGKESIAVTLLRVLDAKVCAVNKNGSVLVAYANGKAHNKAIAGAQKKFNLSKEFNKFATLEAKDAVVGVLDNSTLENAKELKVSFKTKGRGFSGVMKRWNFQGGPAAHGSRFHRAPGSIGNREWPGRVQKGKKMAGHYGNELVSVKNSVVSFDKGSSILVVKGSVSGYNGALGRVKIVK